ncbi:MAG: type II restriction endonuclease, partial [bacterium]
MRPGHLSQYFDGVALKRLSAVEVSPDASNQHEFNGVTALRAVLGDERRTFDARFLYLSDIEERSAIADASVTWYDARERHPSRSEHRLYFPTTSVSELAREGDLFVLAKRHEGPLLVAIAQAGSSAERQLVWLFQAPETSQTFSAKTVTGPSDTELGVAARFILDSLGIDVVESDDAMLAAVLKRFPPGFPTTRQFSSYARDSLTGVSSLDDPDIALLAWMDREEKLFRLLERHLVKDRLRAGFGDDVDGFIDFSLGVQNRRKSRAGHALENHLEQIFIQHHVRYARGEVTENRNKPDFLFPGIVEYRNAAFPSASLTMLGAKSTCKDRWRQVLAEAARIQEKHLLTLEPGISENQTAEMQVHKLRLVVPAGLHNTYTEAQ